MQINPPAGENASDATAGFDALATMMGAMFTAMCKHSEAMTCMMTECVDPNAAPTNGDAGAIGVDSLQQFMPCLCDACPGFMNLFTSLGSTAALLENVTNMTEAEGMLLVEEEGLVLRGLHVPGGPSSLDRDVPDGLSHRMPFDQRGMYLACIWSHPG